VAGWLSAPGHGGTSSLSKVKVITGKTLFAKEHFGTVFSSMSRNLIAIRRKIPIKSLMRWM
jgi:hypothetical protein